MGSLFCVYFAQKVSLKIKVLRHENHQKVHNFKNCVLLNLINYSSFFFFIGLIFRALVTMGPNSLYSW